MLVLSMVALGAAGYAGCTLLGDDAPMPKPLDASSEGGDVGEGGTGDETGTDGGSVTTGKLRLAFFPSKTTAPGIDVCLASEVGEGGQPAFGQPLFTSLLSAPAGIAADQVSAYVTVPAGGYYVRAVPVGSGGASCENAAAVDLGHVLSLNPGTSFTLFVNDQASGRSLLALPDESLTNTGLNVRFVNGTTQDGVSFDLGGGAVSTAVGADVPAGKVAGADNGYVPVDLAAATTIDATLRGSTIATILSSPFAITPGGHVTGFAFSTSASDAGPSTTSLLVCDDDAPAPAGSSWLASCVGASQVGPHASQVRFADFVATDLSPGVDVCIRYQGVGNFVGPLLGTTLTAPSVSAPADVHGGFTYEMQLVSATDGGAPSCGSPVGQTLGTFSVPPAPIANVDGGDGGVGMQLATVAMIGYVPPAPPVPVDAGLTDGGDAGDAGDAEAGADDASTVDAADAASTADAGETLAHPLAYVPFVDTLSNVPAVRLVNVAAPLSLPLSGQTSAWSLIGAGFGQFATQGIGGTLDGDGYLSIAPGSGTLSVLAGGEKTPREIVDWSVASTDDVTFYVYGSDGAQGVGVLACPVTTASGLVSCSVLTPH